MYILETFRSFPPPLPTFLYNFFFLAEKPFLREIYKEFWVRDSTENLPHLI